MKSMRDKHLNSVRTNVFRGTRAAVFFWGASLLAGTPKMGGLTEESQRSDLLSLHSKIRELARKNGRTAVKKIPDFYTSELETDLPQILLAHNDFQQGILLELQGDKTGAMEAWRKSLQKLEVAEEPGKPWVRRVSAAIAQREIADLHHKNDFPGMVESLREASEVINRNPLPPTGDTLPNQLQVEHWIYSGLLMAGALERLQNAPRDFDAQMKILDQALRNACAARQLMSTMTSAEAPASHEQVVDRIVFAGDLSALFTSLFYNLNTAGRNLPNSIQPVWTALLATWATEGTNEHLTPAALDDRRLSPLEAADQFRALSAAIEILEEHNLGDALPKLAKGLSFLKPDACPPDQTSLIIADVLIEGGHPAHATPYLEKAAKGGLSAEAECGHLKRLFRTGEYEKAAERGRRALAAGRASPHPTETRFWLAKSLLKTGRQIEARDEFRRYFEANPGSRQAPEACLLAGMLSFNLGETDTAEHFFRETFARYPASREGQRAAELLSD